MLHGQAGRRGLWLCPICQTPGWRGQRCPQSPPALPAGQSSAAGCPRYQPSQGWQQGSPSSYHTGPRPLKRDKIKPFAITQVELSSFYWLCYSICSRGMQLWMEPRWLSPVDEAPMFLGVLQFNLFSFCCLLWQWNPNTTWFNGPNSFTHVLSRLLYRPHHKNSDQKTPQKGLFANSYESLIFAVSFSAISQNHLHDKYLYWHPLWSGSQHQHSLCLLKMTEMDEVIFPSLMSFPSPSTKVLLRRIS